MIMAVILGMTTKKSTPALWIGFTVWILVVSIHYYIKN